MSEDRAGVQDESADAFVKNIKNLSDTRIELALQNRGLTNLDQLKEEAKKMAREAIKEEIDSVKKDTFVIFGIFTSFIAFIVGEINILKAIDSIYDKIGFSFLFVSFILGFLFGIMFLLDDKKYILKFKQMALIFGLFFVIGLVFIFLPYVLKIPVYYMIIK